MQKFDLTFEINYYNLYFLALLHKEQPISFPIEQQVIYQKRHGSR